MKRPLTARAAPASVRRRIEAARKALAAEAASHVDLAFSRALIERAEQTEAAGDLGRALDLARGARRSIDLAKRRSRVAEELARADVVLQNAKAAGIETVAFERNIAQARSLSSQGDLMRAEKLVRRLSVRTLDQKREKHLQSVLDKAMARLKYAKERGANTAKAESILAEAREALALREYAKIRPLAAKAIEAAEAARRYARAETILNRAAADVAAAREWGLNTIEARKVLTHARESLRRGVYADVQRDAVQARRILREARLFARAESALRETERDATKERRRGADVSRAETLLEEATKALDSKQYARVNNLCAEAWDVIREAAVLRHVEETYAGLVLDLEELRVLQANTGDCEASVSQLAQAIADRDLPAARRLIGQARHAAEAAREAHYRAIRDKTLAIILANAPRGLDPEMARELLRQVDDAVSVGKQIDVQRLIDARMSEADEVTSNGLNERIMKDRDLIVELRNAEQNTVAMEGKLADAAIAVADRRFIAADHLLDAAEHDIYAMRENLRVEAAGTLGQARERLHNARQDGIPVDEATRTLHDAEIAYSEGRYSRAVFLGRSTMVDVDRIVTTLEEQRRREDALKTQLLEKRIEGLQARMEQIRKDIESMVQDNVDLSHALESLELASRAIERGALEEADRQISSAEGIVQGAKAALKAHAEEVVEKLRHHVEEARDQGYLTEELEAQVLEAETAVAEGRPRRGAEIAIAVEETLTKFQHSRMAEEQRVALEKAQSAARKFVAVKTLIEDLRKADIDITGAEEVLKECERALEAKAYDRVDEILAELDDTAKELIGELMAAARALIDRTNRRILEAKAAGVDTQDASSSLESAQAHFDRKEYDHAIECARVAEKQILELLKARAEEQEQELRRARENARTEIVSLKKVLADLGRADISIVDADGALSRAEAAFEEGRYEDVSRELTQTREIADGLTGGLATAASDLVQRAEDAIAVARSGGLSSSRAELVLENARDAVEGQRFVEAIEYKKIIEDILEDLRSQEQASHYQDALEELRARVEAHAKLGADMRFAAELIARAETRLKEGNLRDFEFSLLQVQDAIGASRRAHLDSVVASLDPLVAEGTSLGLPREELDELRTHATEAALGDALEEVYRIRVDLQERIVDAKSRAVTKRALEEVHAIEDLLVQSDRVGVPTAAAKARLDEARHAIEAGDANGFQQGVAEARTALDESRRRFYTQKYESRVHGISVMIADAKRLGAEVGEAERVLGDAERSLRANELQMADILVKQAEVAIGIQIQNFIKNRYPNLVFRLPASGLQANVWNRYAFEVENKGKLPARNVEFRFGGDVETKGLAPIPEIGVDERRSVEIGLKPAAAGNVPVDVGVSYQRMFDENRYELRDSQELKVEPQGTYIVEDVFLIHADGRLITHRSRKFREAIDEDIFSGMLTVVQDFIKDSFKRSKTALRRLEFGDSTILMERSPHTYLAAVLIGDEPKLLPLYMIEILKEIEDRFGNTLEKWTGMLHTLEGIDEIVARLIDVATRPDADMGSLSQSPITLTAKVIEALGVEQTEEVNALLAEAQSTLETDIRLSWEFIEKARAQAETARTGLVERMEELLGAARDTVTEMRSIGADTSQAELLLKEAEEAMQEGKFDRVLEIRNGLHESLERAKGELAAKKVEVELTGLINDIQVARSQNLDVREAESYLTKIESAIQKKNPRQMEEYLRRAKESLARQRRRTVIEKAKADLSRLRETVAEARTVNVDLGDVERILQRVEDALRDENLKDLELFVGRAEASVKGRVEEVLRERYPRLFLESKSWGIQADRWNRFRLNITNKGNWPAKDVTPKVLGPVEVEGLTTVAFIEPDEKVSIDFGVKPKETGEIDLDFEVHYARPLDDAKHALTDTTSVRVEVEGGYGIDDALLIHENGIVICHESRVIVLPEDAARAATLEADAKALVESAFTLGGAKGLQRATMNDQGYVATRGPHVFLVLGVRGTEPSSLPLYIAQTLKEIHDGYGHRLKEWNGDRAILAGIEDLVRKILFVTDVPGVSLGPLEDSPVSRIPALTEKGVLEAPGGTDFLAWARNVIETSDHTEAFGVIDLVSDAIAGPTEEISAQIHQAVLASKDAGALQLTDEQVAAYVDILRRALEAVFLSKERAGLQRYWPVSRLAIKTRDQTIYDAIAAFRKIIVGQSGAKELDIIAPQESWRGMNIDINVHMDSVSAAYKLWAKKIEILLRSQDAWKIKAGLEKGEYSVGIEGQKVRIDPSMVSFVESVPQYVVEEPFEGGTIYLDTRMTKDLLAEGYAKEVVNLVKEARKDMKLEEDRIVEVDLVVGENLRSILKPWKDLILREANALDVRFSSKVPENAYVVETELGESSFYVAIRSAQM